MKLVESRHKQKLATLKCPTCRARMNSSDLCFISRDNKVPIDRHEVIEVKGSWGTKLENVVRKILSIIAKEKDAKVLVFSQWNDVLILMARALQENQIKFVNLLGGKKRFRQNLEIFLSIADLKVLLLPIKSGSNGLNLIEATHVILIEPCINPSLEAQAIGRVHRIGQTKPTFVHRFVIENTIEQRVYALNRKKTDQRYLC